MVPRSISYFDAWFALIFWLGATSLFAAVSPNSNTPVIGPIEATSASEEATSSIGFEVQDRNVSLTGTSSDQSVIPDGGIVFAGIGTHRAIIVSPKQPGRTRITITASNPSNGQTTGMQGFQVTVTARASSWPAMLLSAVVTEKPVPTIRLVFPTDAKASKYEIYRKDLSATNWGELVASLPGPATEFVDTHVAVGSAYEYRVVKDRSYPAFIYAGLRAPMIESRGTLILMVDQTFASDLAQELSRLERDLVGDGWRVIRHDVSRHEDPVKVKQIIKADYDADASQVKSLFLFGHVAIAYSGWYSPDGHHERAFPADVFYADMDGVWTDELTGNIQPGRHETRNFPGDGRYDQTIIPSDVELQVGRVDLFNMPAFLPKTEKELLRQYLEKDHRFRHGLTEVEERGLMDGWIQASFPNQATMFGPGKVSQRPFLSSLKSGSYLWASRAQYGNYRGFNDGGASTADFASADLQAVFLEVAGSYFGEWDIYDDFLRAALCAPTYTLAAAYSMPSWRFHHMALGETAGYSAKVTQNNRGKGALYSLGDGNEGKVHIALMGDPTLKLQPVSPVAECVATVQGNRVRLDWKEPQKVAEGYLVYRSASPNGPFSRRNSSLIKGTSFLEENVPPGSYTYTVRVMKIEVSGSGTYENLSEGVLRTVAIGGVPDSNPPIVSLTAPPRNSTVYNPVKLVAAARDDRGVAKVEFSIDGQLIGTAVEAPYAVQWDSTAFRAGDHLITGKAFDFAGNVAQDTLHVIVAKSDTTPPKVSVGEPASGQRVWGNVIFHASATDNAGVDRVEMRADGQLLGTARNEPYDFVWKTFDSSTGNQIVPDGIHQIKATAYDRARNQAEQIISVVVDSAMARPTILTASPSNLTAQAGQVVDLTYNWQGGPASREWTVFTLFVDEKGNETGDSHSPSIPTHYWSGSYSYPVKLRIARSLQPGSHKIMAGFYVGGSRGPLNAGPGVTKDYQERFHIGTLTILPDSTPPLITSGSLRPQQKVVGKVSLSLVASDNVAIDHAELLVDGRKQTSMNLLPNVTGSARANMDSLFYSGAFAWDTSGLTNGPHRVTLRAVDSGGNPGDLNVDVQVSNPTIFMAAPTAISAKAGEKIGLTYHWSGGPISSPAQVVTELIGESTKRSAFRATHTPAPSAEKWTGNDFNYSEDIALPANLAPGEYKITIRMSSSGAGAIGLPIALLPGPGVTLIGSGPSARYWIGTLNIASP